MVILYYFNDEDFEFDTDFDDRMSALKEHLSTLDMSAIIELCLETGVQAGPNDTKEELIDELVHHDDHFKDFLEEHFEDEAREAYEEQEAERRDPLGFRGLSQRDFI